MDWASWTRHNLQIPWHTYLTTPVRRLAPIARLSPAHPLLRAQQTVAGTQAGDMTPKIAFSRGEPFLNQLSNPNSSPHQPPHPLPPAPSH